MNNKALSYLRSLDFDALWAGNDVVNVRWNGALWNHLILNAHLWPAAERYGLQTLSKRQARPAPGFQGPLSPPVSPPQLGGAPSSALWTLLALPF
jgi:hypothetical protein